MSLRTFIVIFLLTFWSTPLAAYEANFQLIYYSGNPEIISSNKQGGLPALATLLKREREKGQHVLFLHGGRAIAPSTLAAFDRGTHMIDLLNILSPAAFSVGKSEFAFKEDELTLRTKEASFPFLSANLYDSLTGGLPEGIKPSMMLGIQGLDVAVFSLTSPELVDDYTLERVSVVHTAETIERTSSLLREQGADLIIMMTDFYLPNCKDLLENRIVDLIMTSERKRSVTEPAYGLQIIHARDDSAALISIKLTREDNDFSWEFDHTFIPLAPLEQDSGVKEAVNSYIGKLNTFLAVEIGVTETRLDTRKESMRTSENAFGNLTADALKSFFNTEIGLINGGGIRGNRIYSPGTRLTRGDMLREIPFRNHAVQIEVTGKQLLEALENGLSRIEDGKGRFPHVSGLQVRYNPEAPRFRRVSSVMVGDQQLDPDKTYSLATANFLADGGDGYAIFRNCKKLDKFGSSRLLWEYVKDYIAEKERIAPVIEGRLTAVSDHYSAPVER